MTLRMTKKSLLSRFLGGNAAPEVEKTQKEKREACQRTVLTRFVPNTRIVRSQSSIVLKDQGKTIPSKKSVKLTKVVRETENKVENVPSSSALTSVQSLQGSGPEYEPTVDMKNVTDIDAEDHDNPFACAEYAEEIYLYLKKREANYVVPTNYIRLHPEIDERMRAILVDWLIEVHETFKLTHETLFLAISILDRYLAASSKTRKTDLQLIGVTAMLLASKVEEIYAPEINDFVYITDRSYTSSMIRSFEDKMCHLLEFNFADPLCIHFLRRNSKALKVDTEKHILAKYFMELMLPDYESLAFPPSMRAAAALCLAMKITDNSPWSATVTYYSKYTETSLMSCMKRIAQLVLISQSRHSKLVAVTKKYSRAKFGNVASSPCLSSAYIVELPDEK